MRVAISGINANDNPGPGIGVARSLKASTHNHKIIGLSYDANDSGHYLKEYFDTTAFLPFPSKGWNEMSKKLKQINSESKIDLLLPCLDAELPLYIHHQKEVERELGIHLFLPSAEQFEIRGKNRLGELAEKLKAKYPKTIEVNSIDEMRRAIDDTFPFPFLVKGKYYKAYRVNTYYEALHRFDEIAAEWGYPILLQRLLGGVEINLVGLGDGNGKLLGAVAIKKLTTTPIGKIWTAVTIRNENLLEMARRFVRVTGWRGPFELECIANAQGIHIIEINPRFPAWTYFATACGVNLPDLLLRCVQGENVNPIKDYAVGKLLVRFCGEIVADWITGGQSSTEEESVNEAPSISPIREAA